MEYPSSKSQYPRKSHWTLKSTATSSLSIEHFFGILNLVIPWTLDLELGISYPFISLRLRHVSQMTFGLTLCAVAASV